MPTCKLPNCPVAKDGRCLEGRGAACPHLIPDSPTTTQPAQAVEPTQARSAAQKNFHPLPGITPLDLSEARYLSGRGRAMVVALVGMKECGKTTLLARLHQLFLSRPLAGFDFAGGRSLPRFEELNWLATVESGAAQPKMPRTSSQFDNSFIHIAVRPTNGGARVDLLLNDISGETFSAAVAAQSTCDTLLALARADHLVTFVDGAALADPARRHLHASQVADFLQRVLQSGQCGTQTALHLVVSKLDALKGNLGTADAVQAEITNKFANQFGGITHWRIAARPVDGSLPTVEQIGKLFATWVQSTHRYPAPVIAKPPRNTWPRDFCRFGN